MALMPPWYPVVPRTLHHNHHPQNPSRLYPQPAREPCDVNAAVRETIRPVGEASRGELKSELADAPPPVRTDPLVLRSILENLIGNALDSLASPAGTVTVGTTRAAAGDGGRPVRRTTSADK